MSCDPRPSVPPARSLQAGRAQVELRSALGEAERLNALLKEETSRANELAVQSGAASEAKSAFLATKTRDRGRDASLKALETSLELLQTDHVDLWQIHNLSVMSEVDEIFAKGGAVEALLQAKEQGLVRFLGVTGHADPDVLLEAIRRFPFDTILLALNAADRHHLSFKERLLPFAVEKEMGIIGMKIPARGRILSTFAPPPPEARSDRNPGDRPGTLTMTEAMRYVLSLPVSTVIVGCDSPAQVAENVAIAKAFTPLSDAQLASLEEKSKPVARQSLFFRKWEAGG